MTQGKEYYAFISYQREDEKWAKWLANELEHYHLPTTLNGKDLPKSLRPIFRDVDELSAGNLPEQIYHALSISKNLIVVCSPRSAKSEWVNKEIEDFIKIKGGKARNIYPFIIEGVPFSKDAEKECFPEKLRNLPDNEERLGGNINEQGGRNAAVVKIIAGMLGMAFDSLWNKYEREQRRKRTLFASLIGLVAIIAICIAGYIWNQNKLLKEKDWRMMENQARAVADIANRLIDEGNAYMAQKICLAVLPKNLLHPDRPCLPEVEFALRRGYNSKMAEIALPIGHNAKSAAFSSDANKIAILYQSGDMLAVHGSGIGNHRVIVADTNTGSVIQELEKDTFEIDLSDKYYSEHYGKVAFCNCDRYVISGGWPVIRVWDVLSGKLVYRIIEEKETMDSCSRYPKICVSHDGKYFAVSRGNESGIKNGLRIYEAKTGKLLRSYSKSANVISFSPDGESIIAVYEDGYVKELGVNNREDITNLTRITKTNNMDIILFGYHMASFKSYLDHNEYYHPFLDNDRNPSIAIRDIRTGDILNISMAHSKPLTSLSISEDGKTFVSASWDKTVKIWNLRTGELLRNIDMNTNPPYVTYCSADGRKLAIASYNHFYLYSFQQTEGDRTVWGEARKVLLGKDANTLFVSANDSLFMFNSESGVKKLISHCPTVEVENEFSPLIEIRLKDYSGGIANFAISPNCEQVATSTYDGILRIIDVNSCKVIQQKEGLGKIRRIKYSKDGKRLLCLTYGRPPVRENDDSLRIWDAISWELIHTINYPSIRDATFLQDRNTIAYLTYSDFVIQNLQTGEKQVRKNIFESMGLSLTCSPDENYFATCSTDGIIRVFDMKRQLYSITNKFGDFVQFSPDSKSFVAASEKGVDVWNTETGVRIYHIPINLPEKAKEIESEDGRTLYKNYEITNVSFSPDGRNIIWSISDSVVKMTPFPSLQQLINETRNRFKGHQLTPEERRKYYLE